MKLFILIWVLLIARLSADSTWLDSVSRHVDLEAILWSKELLKKAIVDEDKNRQWYSEKPEEEYAKKKCHLRLEQVIQPNVYCFLSFSVPESTWISLSKELEKYNGVIVLRGLPNNSFQELSEKLQRLIELGVNIPVQIHPRLFQDYSIKLVPTFVFVQDQQSSKLAGNVSLAYAIKYMDDK